MWMVLCVMFSNTYKHTFGARWVWKGAAAEIEEGQYQMHTPTKNKKKRINKEEIKRNEEKDSRGFELTVGRNTAIR
jgi:hypothetical protein